MRILLHNFLNFNGLLWLYFLYDSFPNPQMSVNPIPTRWGRNQPYYERHVTTSVRNRVKIHGLKMHGPCRCMFLNRVQKYLNWTNLCSKNLEKHGFLIILPFTLLSNKSCTNLSCTSFFIPQKTCIPRPYCRQKTHLWRSKWYQTIAKVAQLGMFDPLETLFLLVSSAHHTFFNPTSFLRSFISKFKWVTWRARI